MRQLSKHKTKRKYISSRQTKKSKKIWKQNEEVATAVQKSPISPDQNKYFCPNSDLAKCDKLVAYHNISSEPPMVPL